VRSRGALQSLIAALSLLVLSAVQAWAQTAATPSPGSGGEASPIAMVLAILAVLVILGAGVKLYDLRRKRESEAVQLQAQISDALLREQLLFGLPIMATARTSLWRRSPPTIEVAGPVPTPQAREMVLRIVRTEAGRIRSDFQIEDRLAVVPPHAA